MSEEPIVPVASDPTPAPPAAPEADSGETVRPHEGQLDLSTPILEVLTNPELPDL